VANNKISEGGGEVPVNDLSKGCNLHVDWSASTPRLHSDFQPGQ
jgi:hypothetical protein